MDGRYATGIGEHDIEEVTLVARGIATAVAPDTGLTGVQAELLGAIAAALTGHRVDYRTLDPLEPTELADVLSPHDLDYRQRIVHHMVLGELVLRPIPVVVAHRVAKYAEALGVEDDFVRVARRYAQGAYGLAWMDLERSGFVEHVQNADGGSAIETHTTATAPGAAVDPGLEATWQAFAELPRDTLGYRVWDMYDSRAFALPGAPGGPDPHLAQHDFVHVLADYGTNLRGEVEVFALIGRANPDPFFNRDVREPVIQVPGMHLRVADRAEPGRYLIVADFGVVDPDVSAADEAARNNERPETQATAAAMRAVLDEEPVYRDYDWEYLTDG